MTIKGAILLSPLNRFVLCLALVCVSATPAWAGPPYLTDDPQPTDVGHWEIYNFVIGSHSANSVDGEAGLDLNYGAAKDLQLTAVLPIGFDDSKGFSVDGLRAGPSVIELAAKYKFVHADDNGWLPDVSFFPRLFVPTDHRYGADRASLLLPVWAEKDFGPWQVFGGGGYQINPGPDQRNFWQGGLAVNRLIGKKLQLGLEVYMQGRDAVASAGFTALDVGLTYKLVEHWSLLASAGPSWGEDGQNGQVFYLSLKADY